MWKIPTQVVAANEPDAIPLRRQIRLEFAQVYSQRLGHGYPYKYG